MGDQIDRNGLLILVAANDRKFRFEVFLTPQVHALWEIFHLITIRFIPTFIEL